MVLFDVFDEICFGMCLLLTLVPLTLKSVIQDDRCLCLRWDVTVEQMLIKVK
jgi:hypothetical protein